jgi:hypothetical protein
MVQRPGALLRRRGASEAERLEIEPDLRERSPQLVRDARYEIGAHSGELGLSTNLCYRYHGERSGKSKQTEQEWKSRPRGSSDDEA